MSESLNKFKAGVNEVRCLLELDPARTDDLRSADETTNTAAGTAVRRAAVVLLVSHFEGFLKGLVEEVVDSYSSGHIDSRSIPAGIRHLHTDPRLQEILSCGDEQQKVALLGKLSELTCLWVQSRPPAGLIRAEKVSRTVTSAKPDVIDEAFKILGGRNVCDGDIDILSDDLVVPDNIRERLEDMLKCRNDIAHGRQREPTEQDVERYIAFLEHFSQRLVTRARALHASELKVSGVHAIEC